MKILVFKEGEDHSFPLAVYAPPRIGEHFIFMGADNLVKSQDFKVVAVNHKLLPNEDGTASYSHAEVWLEKVQ